jgi:hypothetical protein
MPLFTFFQATVRIARGRLFTVSASRGHVTRIRVPPIYSHCKISIRGLPEISLPAIRSRSLNAHEVRSEP